MTVIYGPAGTFVFPDVKKEAYRRSVLRLNLISAVDGSALNWCEQHVLIARAHERRSVVGKVIGAGDDGRQLRLRQRAH